MKTIAPAGLTFSDCMPVNTGTDTGTAIVFTKHFTHPDTVLSLRPFCVDTDLPELYKRKSHHPQLAALIASSYAYTSVSTFAHSYMVLQDNGRSLCAVDVCRASQDEIADYFETGANDYILRLTPVVPLTRNAGLYSCILATCMAWLALFPAIKSLVVECDAGQVNWQQALGKAGFTCIHHISTEYKETMLYSYTFVHNH